MFKEQHSQEQNQEHYNTQKENHAAGCAAWLQ
jgi:hypothetical protein